MGWLEEQKAAETALVVAKARELEAQYRVNETAMEAAEARCMVLREEHAHALAMARAAHRARLGIVIVTAATLGALFRALVAVLGGP